RRDRRLQSEDVRRLTLAESLRARSPDPFSPHSLRTLRSDERDKLPLDQDDAFSQGLLEFPADSTEILVGSMDRSRVDLEESVLVLLQRARDVGRVAGAHAPDGRGTFAVESGPTEVADEGFLEGVKVVFVRHDDPSNVVRAVTDNLGNGEQEAVAIDVHGFFS